MPVAAVIGKAVGGKIIGAVVGGIAQRKAGKKGNRRADELSAEAVESGKNLQTTAAKMGDRADDRWNFYKDFGENVDIMLIDDAIQMFKETFAGGSERAAARAAEDVAAAFDRSAEVRRRAAFRFGGVDPTSGKFQGLERKTETQRATTEASARFKARRSEEDRARAILQNASNIGARGIRDSLLFERTGAAAESAAGRIFAGQVPDARAEAAGSSALIGDIADKIPFENIFASKEEEEEPAVTESKKVEGGRGGGPGTFKKGGKVRGYRAGGAIPSDGRRGGRINGPGTTRSDSVRAVVDGNRQVRLSAGEFIIPAHIVQQKGERFFNRMIRR